MEQSALEGLPLPYMLQELGLFIFAMKTTNLVKDGVGLEGENSALGINSATPTAQVQPLKS